MSGNEKGSDLPENQGGNQHGGDNTLNFGADSTAAILSVNNPMDIELKVEKTEIPENFKVINGLKEHAIWHTFNKPICLPYDKDLISKVEKGAKISACYFADVLHAFIKDTLPNLFPENFYSEMKLDTNPGRICINPQSSNSHQYGFNLNFIRAEKSNISISPGSDKKMYIRTNVFINSAIPHSTIKATKDNGFFPIIKDGQLQPIEGISVRTGNTYLELPSILLDNGRSWTSKISAPILQTLLGDSPLFFPNYSTDYKINSDFYDCPGIKLKDSEISTISEARECREKLSAFLLKNMEKVSHLAKEFAKAKRAAGISVDKGLENYEPEFLFKYLNDINKEIEEFRDHVPSDIGFKEVLVNNER